MYKHITFSGFMLQSNLSVLTLLKCGKTDELNVFTVPVRSLHFSVVRRSFGSTAEVTAYIFMR